MRAGRSVVSRSAQSARAVRRPGSDRCVLVAVLCHGLHSLHVQYDGQEVTGACTGAGCSVVSLESFVCLLWLLYVYTVDLQVTVENQFCG